MSLAAMPRGWHKGGIGERDVRCLPRPTVAPSHFCFQIVGLCYTGEAK